VAVIGRLEGQLCQVSPGTVLIDVGGVGYLVSITLRAFQDLARRERATLWVHTQVRDDAITLYGFPNRDELESFEQLIAVAGVGPRTALAVLSGLTPGELAEVVEGGDAVRLQRLPGVGRKTAERILLELKGRLSVAPGAVADDAGDAVSALVNLGYSQRDARRVVTQVVAEGDDLELGDVLRLALQRLTR
jgi:Holliday junction DNA helicase RuvA